MEYQLDIQGKEAFYASPRKDFTLLMGDSFSTMPGFDFKFDMIFADPPYFLSNGGISLQIQVLILFVLSTLFGDDSCLRRSARSLSLHLL